MNKIALIFLSIFASVALANETACPPTTGKKLPDNTVVFFYSITKKQKTFYIPVIKLENKKLVVADKMTVPQELTLYNLRDNKPTKVHFKNVHDNVDYDVCRSIGEEKTSLKNSEITLFASQPLSQEFSYNIGKNESEIFNASVINPCPTAKAKYDYSGVALCNADKLIAVSHFQNQTQFWHTKQYRYDVGFAIDMLKDNKLVQITEDCAGCKD